VRLGSSSSLRSSLNRRTGSLGEVRGALAGSVFVSFTGQALLAVSGVVVARLLGPADRGRFALIVLVPAVLAQLLTFGVPLAVTYFTASGVDPQRMLRRLRGPIGGQVIVSCLIGTAVFAVLAVFSSLHAGSASVVAVLTPPGMLILWYGLASLQGVQRFRAFNVLRQAPAALYAFAAIGLYIGHVRSLLVMTLVWSVSYLVAGVTAFAFAMRTVGGSAESPRVAELVRFGLRGFVGAVSPIETFRLDQATIGIFLTPVSLGLYVVGLAFTNLPRFIAQSIGMVAYPHITAMSGRGEAWRAVKEYVLATSAICLLVCGSLIVFANRLIVLFFGEAYASATDVTRVLLIGAAIISIRRLLGDAVRGMGMPGAASIAEVGSWVALLPALAVCIPLWGLVGVGVALAISYAVSLALLIGLVLRHRGRESNLVEEPAAEISTFVPEA
jgi:O-antigen/teichoic acid export membrane protein